MAVVLSRKTAAPELSTQGVHSGGTANWQALLESLTTFQPAGTVCAQVGWINKKSRDTTACFLMAGFYRPTTSDTRLRLEPILFEPDPFLFERQPVRVALCHRTPLATSCSRLGQ